MLLKAAAEKDAKLRDDLLSRTKRHPPTVVTEDAWQWAQAKVAALSQLQEADGRPSKICLLNPCRGTDKEDSNRELIARKMSEMRAAEKRVRKLKSEITGALKTCDH